MTSAERRHRFDEIFRYLHSQDYTALWQQGDHSLEFRGVTQSGVDGFRALLGDLRAADVDAWLGALPPSAVRPLDRAAAVDGMLADIPLPPGFDVGALRSGGLVKDRYQLGAEVAGMVACAWIGRWVDARAAGDATAQRASVAAMATSRRWAILREMRLQGAYSQVVWELADAMRSDAPVSGGRRIMIAESYRASLGCAG